MSKLLVVVGATGSQGRAVIDYFLKNEHAYKLRGLTRKPSSDAAVVLSNKGVEIVQADVEDVNSLKKAFAGADVIFAYTAFSECAKSPEAMDSFKSGKAPTLGKAAAEIEIRHGRQIADAAATVPKLERLVWSSLANVSKWSKGKYTNVTHFDSKAIVFDYMKELEGLKGKVSGLQMGTFADDPVKLPELFQLKKQPDNSFVYSLPMSGKAPISLIDVERDTGAFVSALIKAPSGLEVVGCSEEMSNEQWLEMWAAHNGVEARYEQTAAGVMLENDKVGMGRQMLEVFQYVEELGYDAGDPDCMSPDEFEKTTGVKIPRTKIADHIKNQDWSSIL